VTRGPCSFRKSDVRRAVEAAVKATGAPIQRIEIDPNGKIIIVTGKPGEGPGTNEWDEVLNRGQH
jgi:hypothetical protein